jgi:hypothetical protein
VNTSRLLADGGDELPSSSLNKGTERPRSAEGFGRGGIMKVKESAESWTDSEPLEERAGDMMLARSLYTSTSRNCM